MERWRGEACGRVPAAGAPVTGEGLVLFAGLGEMGSLSWTGLSLHIWSAAGNSGELWAP